MSCGCGCACFYSYFYSSSSSAPIQTTIFAVIAKSPSMSFIAERERERKRVLANICNWLELQFTAVIWNGLCQSYPAALWPGPGMAWLLGIMVIFWFRFCVNSLQTVRPAPACFCFFAPKYWQALWEYPSHRHHHRNRDHHHPHRCVHCVQWSVISIDFITNYWNFVWFLSLSPLSLHHSLSLYFALFGYYIQLVCPTVPSRILFSLLLLWRSVWLSVGFKLIELLLWSVGAMCRHKCGLLVVPVGAIGTRAVDFAYATLF